MKYILLLGLFTALLFRCGGEEASPDRLFVKEIVDLTRYKDVFKYEEGRLIEYKRLIEDQVETKSQFHYLDNQLIKVDIEQGQTIAYTFELSYDQNGLRQVEKLTTRYDGQITNIRTGTFTHQDGVLKSIAYFYSDPTYLPFKTMFEWSNGNISKMNFYYLKRNGPQFSGSSTMTYDTKRNYSNQDIAFIYRTIYQTEATICKNNQLSHVANFGDLVIDKGSQTFTYNTSGYPNEYIFEIYGVKFNPIQINYY